MQNGYLIDPCSVNNLRNVKVSENCPFEFDKDGSERDVLEREALEALTWDAFESS